MAEFNCRISRHGQKQLELEFTYPVHCEAGRTSYTLDVYIFTPAQLHLDGAEYSQSQVLRDMQSHTRYAAPAIPLAKLSDRHCPVSPLSRLRDAIESASQGRELDGEQLIYELQTLVNAYHFEIKARRQLLLDCPERLLANELPALLTDSDGVLASLRALHREFSDGRITDRQREALRWADEAVSVNTEKEIFRLYCAFAAGTETQRQAATTLKTRLANEQNYRRQMRYESVVDADNPVSGETFLYRQGILKKWAQRAMYMDEDKSSMPARVGHLLAGVAAAAAMALAVFAAFLAGEAFTAYSLPWVLLIVISYVFKDRLKEVMRGRLSSLLPRFFSDRASHLVDTHGGGIRVGKSRLWVNFRAPVELPETVIALREAGASPLRKLLPAENVLHIHKQVNLDCGLLSSRHTRLESLTEILRFKIDPWLTQMDDPTKAVDVLVDGEPAKVLFNRVYHMPLIIRLGNGEPRLVKKRLILSRDGIVRTEDL